MTLRTLWLLVFVLLFAPVAAPQEATLTGTVTDPGGARIAGAVVEAAAPGRPAPGKTVTTDTEGRYRLVLPPGKYQVEIRHSGFARLARELTLVAGEQAEWSPRLALERLAATVVVTAQADPILEQNVSLPASVLTRADFDGRQLRWLDQALETTPGVAIARQGRQGAITSLFLGGGNSNFTRVMLDGIPVNEPGGALNLSQLALDGIEKVEVVRGASSALHGSDAMAGAVQLFTRRGTTARPLLELEGEGGHFATGRGAGTLSGELGGFDYASTASYFSTSGAETNDYFRLTTLSGNFGWRWSQTHQLRYIVRHHTSDAGVPGQTLFHPTNRDQHNALGSFYTALRAEYAAGPGWLHQTSGFGARTRQLFDNPRSDFCRFDPVFLCDFPFTVRNRFHRAGLLHQSSYLFPKGGFALGYQYEAELGHLNGLDVSRHNHAGYAELRYQPSARVSLNGGFRVEGNQHFGTRVVPRAGVALALRQAAVGSFFGPTRLRAGYGEGIKEPSLTQTFSADECFPGNPALRPERSRAGYAGFDQWFAGERVRWSADGFEQRFFDIASFTFCFPGGPCPVPPPPGCPFGFGTFFNTDRARARGVDTRVEAVPLGWLRLGGSYSFAATRVLEAPNAFDPALVPGQRLLKRPVHSGQLWAGVEAGPAAVHLAAQFLGPRTDSDFLGLGLTRNPGYARFDLAGRWRFSRAAEMFARVENLFDRRYQPSLGYLAYGRHVRGGMRFRLGGE